MAEYSNELKKLAGIATDMEFPGDLRTKAIDQIGNIGSHEALRVLLDLAANEKLLRKERELALKYATAIVKSRP